jgi:hypothetical protein
MNVHERFKKTVDLAYVTRGADGSSPFDAAAYCEYLKGDIDTYVVCLLVSLKAQGVMLDMRIIRGIVRTFTKTSVVDILAKQEEVVVQLSQVEPNPLLYSPYRVAMASPEPYKALQELYLAIFGVKGQSPTMLLGKNVYDPYVWEPCV